MSDSENMTTTGSDSEQEQQPKKVSSEDEKPVQTPAPAPKEEAKVVEKKQKKKKQPSEKKEVEAESADDSDEPENKTLDVQINEMFAKLMSSTITVLDAVASNKAKKEVKKNFKEFEALLKNGLKYVKGASNSMKKKKTEQVPCKVSDELLKLFKLEKGTQLKRGEGLKLFWKYANDNKLKPEASREYQTKGGKTRKVACVTVNDDIRKAFKLDKNKKEILSPEVMKLISTHFTKIEK